MKERQQPNRSEQQALAGEQPLQMETVPVRLRYLSKVHLLSKYGSVSLAATSADFAAFHAVLTYLGCAPVLSTIIGRSVGSVVAFLLHRSWVFRHAKKKDGNALRIKYVLGIFIGMGLNAAGVWFLNSFAGLEPWPARVASATTVWFFGFVFNKKIVFG